MQQNEQLWKMKDIVTDRQSRFYTQKKMKDFLGSDVMGNFAINVCEIVL